GRTAPEPPARFFPCGGGTPPPRVPAVPPCFRVFLTNGIMEEFGCTADSLENYPGQLGPNIYPYIYSWNLDMMVCPNSSQRQVTYQRDMQTSGGMSYPMDAVLSSVQWDSPSCTNITTACT